MTGYRSHSRRTFPEASDRAETDTPEICQLGQVIRILGASYTYFLWHHPYAIVIFTAEALLVGGLYRCYHQNLVLLDGLYWLLLGMPLVLLFYGQVLQVDPVQTQIIMLKQAVNGIFNALVASLLLIHIPLDKWVNRPPAIGALSLQQTLFNLLVAFVFFPTLTLMAIDSHRVVATIQQEQQTQLAITSDHLQTRLNNWYDRQLRAAATLAQMVNATPPPTPQRQQAYAELIQRLNPALAQLWLLNGAGEPIAAAPNPQAIVPDLATLGIAGETSPTVHLLPQPLDQAGERLTESPAQAVPILFTYPVRIGAQPGWVLGAIKLEWLQTLLEEGVEMLQFQATLLGPDQQIVTSTVADRLSGERLDLRASGEMIPLADRTYHWLPTGGSPVFMVRWTNSFFVQETPLPDLANWVLLMESPAKPQVQAVQRVHIKNLSILLIVSGLALVLATLAGGGCTGWDFANGCQRPLCLCQ